MSSRGSSNRHFGGYLFGSRGGKVELEAGFWPPEPNFFKVVTSACKGQCTPRSAYRYVLQCLLVSTVKRVVTVQKALPYLGESASIILNSSVVNQMGMATTTAYAASKAAVRSLARTLSRELLPQGVRVNSVSPGPIETPIYGRMGLPQEAVEEMGAQIQSQVPMGRFGTADEIATAAVFLASADSSYIAGIDLPVDGGMTQL